MLVRHLQLHNFRNYRESDLELGPGRQLILGDNAQGKSNLLEAVYLLATARSARAGLDGELIGREETAPEQPPFARLQATVERRADSVGLEALVVGSAAVGASATRRASKRLRVNGLPRRAIDFVGQLRAVLFTADDLEIVAGGPTGRRLYVDTAISQLDRAYYGALQRYGRIVQQRNATLRRIREGVAGPDELALWDGGLTKEGSFILAARLRTVDRLAELAEAAHRELSGDARESLQVAYEPRLGEEWRQLLPADRDPAALAPVFAAALAAQRRREIAAGVSLVGPHRDDLALTLNGVSAAAFASRAQVRTASLALRLAEARLIAEASNDSPVLLLDDIVSELDEKRRRSVLESIAGFEQVWFTATDTGLLPPDFVAGCTVHRVVAGALTAAVF